MTADNRHYDFDATSRDTIPHNNFDLVTSGTNSGRGTSLVDKTTTLAFPMPTAMLIVTNIR